MMLERINAVRAGRGLPALAFNQQLAAAAVRHATDMAANPWITAGDSHLGSDGSTVLDRAWGVGYSGETVREVTGWGWGNWNEEAQMNYWVGSPLHADILFDPKLSEAGDAYVPATGGPWQRYWVVDFGRGEAPPEPARPYTVNVPAVAAQGAAQIDMLSYLKGDGRAYMVQHPSGAQEKFRTVEWPAHRWGQLKNSQWEEFWYTDDYIWRGVDTSPGDGQYYRQFEDNAQGARWCPRRMTVGQAWVAPVTHTVQTYDKATCRPVDHHRNGTTTNRLTLVAHHDRMTWGGVTVEDMIQVVSSTGETMYFGRNYGLCAWKSAWGSSAISNVLPPHEADNQPETGCFGP